MPGAFGPILTTGVALSAAAVVVANPVSASHPDVRIPATVVSTGTGQDVDMLNEDFIKAVAPTPAGSTNPLAVLKDLVSTLVADVADLGKYAMVRAFTAGATVVSRPELTGTSYPYLPPAPAPVVPVLPSPVGTELQPVVEHALTAIISDAGTATDPGVLTAAFLAGAALASDPGPLLANLQGFVDNAFKPLQDNTGSAVPADPVPVFAGAIRTAVERYLPAPARVIDSSDLPSRRNSDGGVVLTARTPDLDDQSVSARVKAGRAVPGLPSGVSRLDSPIAETVSTARGLLVGGRVSVVDSASPRLPSRLGDGGTGVSVRGVAARADHIRN